MVAVTSTSATAALLLLALAPIAVRSQNDLNTYTYMLTYNQKGHNGAACGQRWANIKSTYFSGSQAARDCGDILFKAMNETTPANCPGGPPPEGSKVGSPLWNCMTGNGNNTVRQ